MKTKIFTLLFAIVASIGIMTAETHTGSCGDNLTWTVDTETGVLTIFGTGKMNDYRVINQWSSGTPWNSYIYSIKIVIIEDGVTCIGSAAFYNCSSLTSITIPNSVTSIGSEAFINCSSLTSITIPNSVTSIGSEAFINCSSLTSITIPNSVTSIGDYAFSDCRNLLSITIPNSVTSIGDYAFRDIPNIVYNGTATGSPWGAKNVNGYVEGYLLYSDASKTKLLKCSTAFIGEIVIPNSVTSIGNEAFYDCSRLTSVTIPNSVTSIGNKAFYGCSGLTSVTIGNSVTSIGERAFYECRSLTSVTIPNSITSIGNEAFYDCSRLTSVTIGNSVTSIGNAAFGECHRLTSIYVPCGTLDAYKNAEGWSDYASLIRYAPYSSYNINKKAENGNITTSSTDIFTMCDTEHPVICTANPDRGCYFVRWADGNTENSRTIELSQDTTMEAIFDYLLEGKCGKDNALTWTFKPASMALNITGKGALSENYTYGTFIESLTIGNEITSIGEDAFYKCTNLKNVILGTSVKVLEARAFYNCSSIETITCYSMRPPTVNQNALYDLVYSTIVYVPADYLTTYKMHDVWGLYDVRPLGAVKVETEEITITPSDNTVDIVWPKITGATTYELVIRGTDGNIVCTLIFNAQGHLTQIDFAAPARGNAPEQTQTAGFAFTVTGLNSVTTYNYTITSKDVNGKVLDTKTGTFTTDGIGVATNLEHSNTNADKKQSIKVIHNGNVYILNGGNTYNLQGMEVK